MVEQVEERYETTPGEMLIDGGFAQHDQIDALEAPEKGCTVYAPVPKPRDPKVDRHAPKPGDSPTVAAWRARRATAKAQTIYKERAPAPEGRDRPAPKRGLRHPPGRRPLKGNAGARLPSSPGQLRRWGVPAGTRVQKIRPRLLGGECPRVIRPQGLATQFHGQGQMALRLVQVAELEERLAERQAKRRLHLGPA